MLISCVPQAAVDPIPRILVKASQKLKKYVAGSSGSFSATTAAIPRCTADIITAKKMMAIKTYPTKAPGLDSELSKLYRRRVKKLTFCALGASGSP